MTALILGIDPGKFGALALFLAALLWETTP